MKHTTLALALLPLLALFAACNKETEKPAAVSTDYFPVTKGHYVIYQTDSTLWDDFTRTVKRKSMQLRYTVTDTFHDLNQQVAYKMLVERRDSVNLPWDLNSVFYVLPGAGYLDYVQNNLRIRKLIYPVAQDKTWDGNSQIAISQPELQYFQGWEYRYTDVAQPYSNGLKSFENTVSIPQADMATGNDTLSPQDYADRTFSKEVYARGVGLVDRELEHWIYDRSTNQQFFRKGYAVRMRAVENN